MLRPAQSGEGQRERDILWLFDIGLLLKSLDGVLEIIVAIAVAFVPRTLVVHLINVATAGELSEDRTDIVAHFLRNTAHAFSVSNHFLIALYLSVHGLIKVALVVGIFKGKQIAYPLFMATLAVFSAYEAYLGILQQNVLLGALAVFDVLLILLTAYEYRRRYPNSFSRGTRGDYAGQ